MNELQYIRDMAKMIVVYADNLEKELEQKKRSEQPEQKIPPAKFKVGDLVRFEWLGKYIERTIALADYTFGEWFYWFDRPKPYAETPAGGFAESELALVESDGWRSGPPPHVGWWNASADKGKYMWRWWNGEYWSLGIHKDSGARDVANAAKTRTSLDCTIYWTTYWPDNARVPRVNPGR